MSEENVELVRAAYGAYVRGDIAAMLAYVDPDLEWTFLDPSLENPEPQTCHGREQLETALARQTRRGSILELEEVTGIGGRVVVTTRIPGVDEHRARKSDDRNYDVLTLRAGRIVALRACHSREEARVLAGLESRT
jgi:ketosteroid isomerase-like protein